MKFLSEFSTCEIIKQESKEGQKHSMNFSLYGFRKTVKKELLAKK
jgi:hypothetical protein